MGGQAVTEKPSHDGHRTTDGHRKRLHERFVKGGAEAMPDYEMLELVLFAALPRRDTKPLAKALIARFGGFAEVIAAKRERRSMIVKAEECRFGIGLRH